MMKSIFATILFMLFCPRPAIASTWYVKADGTGDVPTIQTAIDTATAGDTVLVAAGTYTWTAQGSNATCCGASMIVLKSGVALISESGPAVTILDAESMGRVIFAINSTGLIVDGFWIRGGNALDDTPVSLSKGAGGGMMLGGTSIIVRNNLISHNFALYFGGGIELDHDGPVPYPLIENNVFFENAATFRGAAMEFHALTKTTVRNNTFINNDGGGIGIVGDDGVVENNIFVGTTGTLATNAPLFCSFANPAVRCNALWSNAAGDSICGTDGGGNFVADPLFCEADAIGALNFAIRADSPCAPGNHPGSEPCGLIGARPVDCGSVPVDKNKWGSIKQIYRRGD